jgi:hypothetical protein
MAQWSVKAGSWRVLRLNFVTALSEVYTSGTPQMFEVSKGSQ